MEKTKIYYDKKQELKEPVLIVGLPGIGNVGSLVAEHIRNELDGKKYAVLYSPYLPHQAIMQSNGGLRLVSNRFYHCKDRKGRSILLLVGDTQPSTTIGQYHINERIIRFFKSRGGRSIYTIGGYSASNQYVQNPRVFGVANNAKFRKELARYNVLFGKAAGSIYGAAGLIPALSKRYGIKSACLMGETGLLEIDANAAKAVLEVMKNVLDIDITFSNLNKIKRETEKIIKDIEEASRAQEGRPAKDNFTYIR
ncbi:MAG: proteasome assembly chaperone family protein [Candidatus Marsarchaeota archaeon]|nr:proteasome assembly chaperone family protein [Candidatus Marsarchaeota archaeon]